MALLRGGNTETLQARAEVEEQQVPLVKEG
jgi:hypothetical protein